MNDLDLWKCIKYGDKGAFKELYHRYYPLLFSYARRMHFDSEIIKDCLQDVFVRIYLKRDELPDALNVKPYLYRSLINALLDTVKNIRNNSVSIDDLSDLSIEDDGLEKLFSKSDSDHRMSSILKNAFGKLSIKQKNILYLRYIHEMSWDELAHVFEMSPHSCMNLVGRAIAKLKEIICENRIS